MNRHAIVKAEQKLERMRQAVRTMKEAKEPNQIERSWEDFIIAANTFYSALEQGAKDTNKSKGWFAKRKHIRRTDPLLSYVRHARHAEEHGIRQITVRGSSQIALKERGAAITVVDTAKGTWTVTDVSGDVEFANDKISLVPVYDGRSGTWFDPPTKHLGQDLENKLPASIAQAALTYLEQMFVEAHELASGVGNRQLDGQVLKREPEGPHAQTDAR